MPAAGSILAPPPRDVAGGLLIRELEPADRRALLFVFRHLGERSRYQRVLGFHHVLTSSQLRCLTELDRWHRDAVIAWSQSPRAPIGVARYIRLREFDLAEVAVTVIDKWQRRGVGTMLVLELRERAIRAGIRRFTATMFHDNKGALALAGLFGPADAARASGGVIELSGSWQAQRHDGWGRR